MARHCDAEDTATTEVWEIDGKGNKNSLLMQAATFSLALECEEKTYTFEHHKEEGNDPFEVFLFKVDK